MYQPQFVISSSCLNYSEDVGAAKEDILLLPLSGEWQLRLKEQACLSMIESGLRMDGIRLSQTLIKKVVVDDSERDESVEIVMKRVGEIDKWKVQMVRNYIYVRKYVEQLINLGIGDSPDRVIKEVRRINELLTEKLVSVDRLGEYREYEVKEFWARDWWSEPTAIEIDYQMSDLWNWWKSDGVKEMYLPVAVAILAFELLRIRPFESANGRTVALLSWWLLSERGYYANGWYAFEEWFDWSMMSQGDLTLWIDDFMKCLAKANSSVKETVKRLSGNVTGSKRSSVVSDDYSQRQKVLLELFKLKQKVTMSMARGALPGVSDDTIWRELKWLLKKKMISKKGSTRGTIYVLRKKG